MLRSFTERYLPFFQAPDAPGAGSVPSAPSSTPSTPTPDTASTTSPSSASEPATPSSSDGADSSFNFMFDPVNENPLEGLGLSPPEPKAQEPKAEPSAPAKPEPAVKPAEPAPQTPAATPAPTEPTSPTTANPAAPNLDPYDPGQLAQHLAQNEEQVVQYVAENLFKLSPEDVEELESNVVGTIPKLLARSFVSAQRNLLMQMSQIIPTMIQRQGELTKRHSEAENEFYARWPDLKKDQHNDLVLQYARVYGQMHPQATRQERIEAVGPMVMMAAKIVPGAAQPAAAAKPASPMAPMNGRPPQPTPFVPASPSAGGASSATMPQLSAVEAMFASEE